MILETKALLLFKTEGIEEDEVIEMIKHNTPYRKDKDYHVSVFPTERGSYSKQKVLVTAIRREYKDNEDILCTIRAIPGFAERYRPKEIPYKLIWDEKRRCFWGEL